MIEFTPEAETIWQEYVGQVRKYLSISKAPEPEEIVSDLNEHVQQELQGISEPVSPRELEEVIKRLGNPRQWVPEDDLSWWQQMVFRLRTGPEDWRLAYLSLAVLVFGALLGPLGLLGSFCLSRAALAVSEESEIQAKRWLIYPSLIIVYFLFGSVILFWPIVPLASVGGLFARGGPLYPERFLSEDWGIVLLTCSAVAVGMTVWWTILLLILRRYPNLLKVIFRPFADSWKTKRLWRIVVIVAVVAIVLTGITATMYIYSL